MKLKFEQWVDEKELSEEAHNLFKESIICYKASAYRASLLFSYLGFLTIIKERILNSEVPSGFVNGEWQKLKKDITSYEKWDTNVIEAIKINKENKKIFDISEDIRSQVNYWKGRRNDCAHAKDNIISYSHIESFWAFLESNLAKFVVVGSRDEMLNKIRIHFDYSKTPENTDFSYIIKSIPSAIQIDEFDEFLEQLYIVLKELMANSWFDFDLSSKVFSKMLEIENNSINDKIIKYIISNEELAINIANYNPEKLVYFHKFATFIRSLWYDKIGEIYYKSSIASVLLRNNIIPESQVKEFIRKIVHQNNDSIPNEEDLLILEKYNYFDVVIEIFNVSQNSSYEWWYKKNRKFTLYCLGKIKLEKEFVENLLVSINNNNCTKEFYDCIVEFSRKNDEFKNMLSDISIEIGVLGLFNK
ncbi:hypothetical protein [Clostridium estertheticum]|uniref:hypothetical protein n=1 Tax=Clostridium estertheticum TaxID=238834 RepID=UPI001CF4E1CE|nr:hypothetical protein [Clostridium estertheticum]MCB2353923.1 hypothetical protein [Clostridium estertheticum]WAG43064.1 hypothetical protein LL065_10440 [Clostridium estertheticum]